MTAPKRVCECGCGQPTPIAKHTDARRGNVKGQPTRFVYGHKPVRTSRPAGPSTQPCGCGCGQPTLVAKKTDARRGVVKGHPQQYINGHNPLTRQLCECGCGEPAPLAKETDRRRGVVQGRPCRFLPGHGGLVKAREARARPVEAPAVLRDPDDAAARYAGDLLHGSELLVGAVRFDGPGAFRAHLAAALRLAPPPGVDPVEALVTVLAAQIDPDTTVEQRLGWVRAFDRAGQAPTPPRQLPVRASPRKENAA